MFVNEPTGGFISREKAIEALMEEKIIVKGLGFRKTMLDGCIDILQNIPDANVVIENHGRWIDVGKTDRGTPIRKCSNCGMEKAGRPKSNYCPDCGCHMNLTIIDSINGQQEFII